MYYDVYILKKSEIITMIPSKNGGKLWGRKQQAGELDLSCIEYTVTNLFLKDNSEATMPNIKFK